ncbi:hypothetical protein [Streptomyces vinaceus]|uniref:hypothetical protein n=1 Tax=Streptomyces vinaceus TaxID=1960 RepID=UPI003692083E
MTHLTETHSKALDELIDRRMDRQMERRHVFDGEASALIDLVRYTSPDADMVPVGMWDGEALVAAFVLWWAAPQDGWTIEERQERTLLVSLAHTHPEYRRLGRVLTPWLRDYAARQPTPPAWVRCAVRVPHLALYLHDACGWQNVRAVEFTGRRALHLLQHAPAKSETLWSLIRSDSELAPSRSEQEKPA